MWPLFGTIVALPIVEQFQEDYTHKHAQNN